MAKSRIPAAFPPVTDGGAGTVRSGPDPVGPDPVGAGPVGPAPDPERRWPVLTRSRPFGALLLITGAVSWIAGFALMLDRIELYVNPNATVSCDLNPWVSCGAVMKTHQAELFGFPNPLIGVFAFAVIITVGMALLSGARFGRWFWIGLQTGVTLGFIMIVWLWSQALYAIGILCPYCMVVWAMMIPMFVFVTLRNFVAGTIRVPASVTRFLTAWAWVIVGLLYLGVIASIFFRFINIFIGGGAG